MSASRQPTRGRGVAAGLLTLASGGAHVVATGNLSSAQDEVVEYLRAAGADVVGERTTDVGARVTSTRCSIPDPICCSTMARICSGDSWDGRMMARS